MNRVILGAIAISASVNVSATSIRMDDGQLLRPGDSGAKLAHYMGRPSYSETAKVCAKPTNTVCRDGYRWGYRYQYFFNGRTYTIDVLDGVIVQIDSSR